MRSRWLLASLLLLLSTPAGAVDLSAIPRTLPKEPIYQSTPKYCLLVFGLEAKTRIWLVLDGDVLYVDQNANGDLTEPAERFKLPAFGPDQGHPLYAGTRDLTIGTIVEGKLKHEQLEFSQHRLRPGFKPRVPYQQQLKELVDKDPGATTFALRVNMEWQPRPGDRVPIFGRVQQWSGQAVDGWLQFADRPQKAPVVHFAGPLHMALALGYSDETNWSAGWKEVELAATIGTPGVGRGTFVHIGWGNLLYEDSQPQAEIRFPVGKLGAQPILRRVSLKSSRGNAFSAPVQIPQEAGAGTAAIRLSLSNADVTVAPAQVGIRIVDRHQAAGAGK